MTAVWEDSTSDAGTSFGFTFAQSHPGGADTTSSSDLIFVPAGPCCDTDEGFSWLWKWKFGLLNDNSGCSGLEDGTVYNIYWNEITNESAITDFIISFTDDEGQANSNHKDLFNYWIADSVVLKVRLTWASGLNDGKYIEWDDASMLAWTPGTEGVCDSACEIQVVPSSFSEDPTNFDWLDTVFDDQPIRVTFWVVSSTFNATGAGGVMRNDGSSGGVAFDSSLTHLDDVSGSLSSQISSEGIKAGDGYAQSPNRQDAISLKYDPDANVFVAQEVGINDYTVIPFRIESDVPIVAGDEKILRTVPFEAEIDSCTLFVPEGVASGNVIMGLDKWEPGSSYPAAAQKVDMIGLIPTKLYSVTTSGNTFYTGITYGDIWNTGTSWAQPSLDAGSILSINVNANTANVNTIIGDIALKRIS